MQHALQKTDKALETLSLALKGAPKTPLCKFEKASILFSSERHKEALAELEELKILAPKESPVYFLMGKVHNKRYIIKYFNNELAIFYRPRSSFIYFSSTLVFPSGKTLGLRFFYSIRG